MVKNFKFRLQNVLDIKVKSEDEGKIKYSKAQSDKKEVEDTLKNLKENYQKYSSEIEFKNGVEREITLNYLKFTSTMIDETKKKLKEKQLLLDEARLELLNKQIERKSLEKLKENKYELYKQDLERKEQAINDEFGMQSYLRGLNQSI